MLICGNRRSNGLGEVGANKWQSLESQSRKSSKRLSIPVRVCIYARTDMCVYVYKSRTRAGTRAIAKGALVRPPPWWTPLPVRTVPCSKQRFGLTLDISEAGHARATCLLRYLRVNFNWGANLTFCLAVPLRAQMGSTEYTVYFWRNSRLRLQGVALL